jgi:drug/metabolite transporter (DMT)-like permease
MKPRLLLVYLLLLFASLSWAGSFVAVRVIHQEIPPIMLGFLRFVIATPVMFFLLFVLKKPFFLSREKLSQLVVLALTGVTLLYILQFTGVSLTSASTGGVLINTNVLFISLFSALFLHEKFTSLKAAGVFLSFFGVILVMFGQMSNEQIVFDSTFLFGSILVILSAVCWAVYSIVGKHMLRKDDQLVVNANAFLIGTLLFVPFVFSDVGIVLEHISLIGVFAVLYLGLFCSVFAYIAWYYALSKSEAAESAVFLNFIPLFTILLSFFIGEYPTPLFLGGAGLIILGVFLVQKAKKTE